MSPFHPLYILALSYKHCLNSSLPSLPLSFLIFVVTSVATNQSSCHRLSSIMYSAQLFGACRSSPLNPMFTFDVLTISTCICSRHQLWNSPMGYTYLWIIFLIFGDAQEIPLKIYYLSTGCSNNIPMVPSVFCNFTLPTTIIILHFWWNLVFID